MKQDDLWVYYFHHKLEGVKAGCVKFEDKNSETMFELLIFCIPYNGSRLMKGLSVQYRQKITYRYLKQFVTACKKMCTIFSDTSKAFIKHMHKLAGFKARDKIHDLILSSSDGQHKLYTVNMLVDNIYEIVVFAAYGV